MNCTIYFNSSHVSRFGDGFSQTIRAKPSPAFSGTLRTGIAFLEALPVGQSIEVRCPTFIRSCMNKPALWADLRAYLVENRERI